MMHWLTPAAFAGVLFFSAASGASVDASGRFTTSVRFEVPAYRELTPGIGLSYGSNAGNSVVGVGWRLDGLSAIERSRPRNGVPRYTSGDTFTIDGADLEACSGNSPGCRYGGTHMSRIEAFRRITYDATSDAWIVWSKDGTRSRYRSIIRRPGTTTTFRWVLDSVTDTHGNRVDYDYICPRSNECYPSTITYGEGVACGYSDAPPGKPVPGGSIRFRWEDRSDVVSHAIGGGIAELTRRLASVEVRMHQGIYAVYDLHYGVSASSGSSILTSVQHFGSDAALDAAGHVVSGTAMPQTVFSTPSLSEPRGAWSADAGSGAPTNTMPWDANGYAEGPFTGNMPQVQPTHGSTPAQTRIADINGDGRDDTLVLSVREDPTTGFVHQVLGTALSTPTGYSFRTFDPDPAGNTPDLGIHEDFLVGDANGDGMTDILQIRNDSVLDVWQSNGDGTFVRTVSQPVPWPVTTAMPSTFSFGGSLGATIAPFTAAMSFHLLTILNLELEEQFFVGDVDGDLRADFVQVAHDIMNNSAIIRVAISTGNGFNVLPDFSTPWRWASSDTKKNRFFPGDVDGDGRVDLVHIGRHEGGLPGDLPGEHATIELAISQGNGTFAFRGTHNGSAWNDDDQWFPGDFDGDAKTDIGHVTRMAAHGTHTKDHVMLRVAYSDGMGGFTWTTADTNFPWWRTSPCLDAQLYPTTFLAADINGDMRSDLIVPWEPTGDCNTPRMNLAVALSRPNDTFELRPNFRTFVRDWGLRDDIGIHTADVNGDRKADIVTTRWRFPEDATPITIATVLSPNAAEDYQNWNAAELDGDGRTDFYYVYFKNPGYRISTLRRTLSGYTRVDTTVLPDSGIPGLDDPQTGSWMAADVGGPFGKPDGKVDLVQVDASRWRVNTLLSRGDGTFTKVSSLPYPSSPPPVRHASWRLMDVDGDDLADLVNVEPTAPGVVVRTLVASGNGTFLPRTSQHFTTTASGPFGIYTETGGFRWRVADVDDDGRADLVTATRNFDGSTFATVVYTLLSTGSGWEERSWRGGPSFPDSWRFMPAELNGDGATDLVYVQATPSGPAVHSLTSLGNGDYQARLQTLPLSDPSVYWMDAHAFKAVDLDRDGRSELVRFGAVRNTFTMFSLSVLTLWNQGGSFRAENNPYVALWGADATLARIADGNGDGRPDIVLPHYGIKSASPYLPSDRIAEVANGMGGHTSVRYTTSAGANNFVPAGLRIDVVSSVSVKEDINPASVEHATNYRVEGLTWSSQERRLLGFSRVTASDAHTVRSTDYELSDACGAREASSSLSDTAGGLIQRNESKYVATGTGAPYRCLLSGTTLSECEGTRICRDTAIAYTYDYQAGRGDFGNIVVTYELGDVADREDDRRIEDSFHPNTNEWLVSMAATRDTFGIENGSWRLSSSTRNGYDRRAYTDPPDATGDLTQVSTWDDVRGSYVDVWMHYDSRGNLQENRGPPTRWNPSGAAVGYKYDCTFSLFPVAICDDLHCREVHWDLNRAKPYEVIGVNGETTAMVYDALGRETNVFFPDGSETRVEYPRASDWGTRNQHIRESRVDGSPGDGVVWRERYFDGLGRTTSEVAEGGRAKDFVYYEATDLLARSSASYYVGQAAGTWTNFAYDLAQRPLRVTLPDGATFRYLHEVGQVTVTNPLGARKVYLSDGFGRIEEIREELRSCVMGNDGCTSKWTSTRYAYDTAGHVKRVTDDVGNVTSIDWSSRGSATKSCDPDRGCQIATYDEAGKIESSTDALGQVVEREYDVLGRVISARHFDANRRLERDIRSFYDVDPATGSPAGASIGRLIGYDDRTRTADGSERYVYDPAGRITHTAKCVEAICESWEQVYDVAGRPKDLVYPDGEVVTTVYDEAGYLVEIGRYVRDVDYDAEGRPELIAFGNGALERFHYDGRRGWLDETSIDDAFGGTLFKAGMRRDRAGRPLSATEYNHQAVDFVYGYDSLDRLTSVTATDGRYDDDIMYDTIGNITQTLRNGRYDYSDPAHVHAATAHANDHFQYDGAGDLRDTSTLKIEWTVDHQPKDIINRVRRERVLLDYDPSGARVKKASRRGTRYTLGGLVERDQRGALVKNYFMGGRRIVRDDGRAVTYFHTDHVGNVRVTTDDRGFLQNQYDYTAFGDIVDRTEVIDNDFELAGRETDDETGLVLMGSRYYHPGLGKFISADTVVPDVLNPQAYNRYAYVYNDPLTYTDPSGHGPFYQANLVQDPSMPGWVKVTLESNQPKKHAKPIPRAKHASARAPRSDVANAREVATAPLSSLDNASPSAPPLVQADVPFNPSYDPAKLESFWQERAQNPRYDVMREAEYVVAGAIMTPVIVFGALELAPAAALTTISEGVEGTFLGARFLAMRAPTLSAFIQGAGFDAWMQIAQKGLSDDYDYKRMMLTGAWTAMGYRVGGLLHGPGRLFQWRAGEELSLNLIRFALAQPIWLAYGRGVGTINAQLRGVPAGPESNAQICSNGLSAVRALGWSIGLATKAGTAQFPEGFRNPTVAGINSVLGTAQWQLCSQLTGQNASPPAPTTSEP